MPIQSGTAEKMTALLLKSAAQMSSGPRPRSWAAGCCHHFVPFARQIRDYRASRTNHQSALVVSEDLPHIFYAVTRHQPPPARHPGGRPSGGDASRAPERTALQVARVPGPQPLMSDSAAARLAASGQRKDVAVQWARSISNKHVHWGSTRLLRPPQYMKSSAAAGLKRDFPFRA